jgi:hypothetical protein
MFTQLSRGFRRTGPILAIVALLAFSAAPVSADTTPGGDGTYTQSGASAEAWSQECVANDDATTTCSSLGISAFSGRISDSFSGRTHGSQVCASLETFTFDDETGESVGEPLFENGCLVDLPRGVLAFDRKLTSFSVAPTTLTISQLVCDEETCEIVSARDVVVEGTWTGFGSIQTGKSHSSYGDDLCRYAETSKQTWREADVDASIDAVAFPDEAYGTISNGRSTFRSRCDET